jgi:phosphoribosyl-dephospho-CoA transferase
LADAFVRHDLVRVDAGAWADWLASRTDLHGLRALEDWGAAGRPLIVRRRMPGESGPEIPLGLPLPPADGRRRIGLALPASALSPATAPDLAAAVAHAPAAWHPTLDALVDLGRRHGIVPRPFGSLLWQAVTGLAYLGAASDLDLLWPGRAPVPAALLDGIAAVADAAPMRIDGEILLPDGTGLHWRELREAPEDGSVLAKGIDRLGLRSVACLRARLRARPPA